MSVGRFADAFFKKQQNERVIAQSPNSRSGSLSYPDRELAGTGMIVTTPGRYETPGSQRVVDANTLLPAGALPGMSGGGLPGMAGGGLPGMSGGGLPGMAGGQLPGMGFLPALTPKNLLIGALIAAGGYMLWKRSRRGGGSGGAPATA